MQSNLDRTNKDKGETIMKTMKNLFASLLAVMLMAAMLVIPASAAGEYTITVNGNHTGHTYKAYQIFSGTLSNTGVLADIEWGTGVKGNELLAALQSDAAFGTGTANSFINCVDAEAVSKVVASWSPDSATLDRFAELVGENLSTIAGTSTNPSGTTYTIEGLDAGYYLVMDIDVPEGDDANEGDAYTKYIIRVVRNVQVSPKGAVPTVTKTVHTSENGTYREYEDTTVTYDVWFKLEGTLPSNYTTDYPQYRYQFVDTLPGGLTYKKDASSNNYILYAYILHDNDTTTAIDTSAYTVDVTGQVLTVSFANLKTSLPDLLTTDKIVVKYSATLNTGAVIGGTGNVNRVILKYSNDPNEPASETDPSMGTTAADTAKVYTYQLNVTKVDGIDTTKALSGAQFYLYRNVDASTKVYAKVDANGKLIDSVSTKADASVLESDADGNFTVSGLDAGTYWLEEIKAPDGYNKMDDPVRVTITPEYTNDALSALKYEVDGVAGTGNHTTGAVSVQVKNNAGATLPSTGGMGTTLFYIIGIALMAGAVVVLLAKKRTNNAK